MSHRLSPTTLRLLPVLCSVFVASIAPGSVPQTLANLKSAYAGETAAVSKYTQYAKAATKENMPYEAGLFTAISRSESFHARNHLRVLRDHNVLVKPSIYTGKVGTTIENVADSRIDETQEYTVMYPEFISRAKSEGLKDAVSSFNYALQAEKGHAMFFTRAGMSEKAGMKMQKAQFYVCSQCGQTFARKAPAICPVCGKSLGKYAAVK